MNKTKKPGVPAESGQGPEKEAPPGKFQAMLVEYGSIAIVVLLSISLLSFLGFAAAFMVGMDVEGTEDKVGIGAALAAGGAGWLLTKPFRIPLALVLTPVVAKIWRSIRGRKARVQADDETQTP